MIDQVSTSRRLRCIERTARAFARRFEPNGGILPADLDEYTNPQLAALLLEQVAALVVAVAEVE